MLLPTPREFLDPPETRITSFAALTHCHDQNGLLSSRGRYVASPGRRILLKLASVALGAARATDISVNHFYESQPTAPYGEAASATAPSLVGGTAFAGTHENHSLSSAPPEGVALVSEGTRQLDL